MQFRFFLDFLIFYVGLMVVGLFPGALVEVSFGLLIANPLT